LDVIFNQDDIAEMQWSIEFGKFRHPNTKVDTLKRRKDLQRLLMENRCLVPVNRFYEWPDPKVRPKYQGIKTRFCIHTPDDAMFLGGIYKVNQDGVMQFNILTTEPTAKINEFHHRSPVIVDKSNTKTWLGSDNQNELFEMMEPYEQDLIIYECSAYVDNGRHEGPECMEPLEK
jgi:putative SOS response-associated peptidase YedK